MRARWLHYHSGPSGYGIRRKKGAIPLVTGIHVHRALAELILAAMHYDWQQVGVDTLPEMLRIRAREVIGRVCEDYRRGVKGRGLEGAEVGSDELEYLIREQTSLLAGLLWGALRVFIPWLMREWVPLSVEEEEELVLGCTCGLGEGVGGEKDHAPRECRGLLLMLRPDLIMKHRATGVVSNCDWKTGASVKWKSWQDQWAQEIQLAIGAAGAERRLGVEIPETYVFGLHKGSRKTQKLADGSDGPRRQDSILCYAWRKRANPPHWEEEWATRWEYVDEWGKGRNLKGKGFDKTPVWEGTFERRPQGWTPMEYYVWGVMDLAQVREHFVVVGPHQRPRHLLPNLFEALLAEEQRWLERRWVIYEALAKAGGRMDHPEVRATLNREVPQSWECRKYRSLCQFAVICQEEGEWGDPLRSGLFELRRPHHEPEIQEMRARGIEPPAEEWEEEEDDE